MKTNYLVTTSMLLLAWAVCETAASNIQEPVEGVVVQSESGEFISGVTVRIEELDAGTMTDREGAFLFSGIPAGTYTMVISERGYRTRSVRFNHPGDEKLIIRLEPIHYLIDEIIVTSSPMGRSTRYQPAQALNQRELHRRMETSLGEMFNNSPGIAMRSFGPAPSRPVIRGLDGERVLLLENGERMGDFSATSVDHAISLDPLAVERAEIVRGPASLLYGSNALGGVINLFSLEQPRSWDTGMDGSLTAHGASVNRMAAGRLRSRYGTERWALSGSAVLRSAGDLRTPAGVLPDTWADSYRVGTGFGYRHNQLETGFAFTAMQNNYGIPDELDDPDESLEIRSERRSFQSASTLDLEGRLFEQLEVRLHGNYNRLDDVEIEIEPDGSIEEDLEKRLENRSLSSTILLRHYPFSDLDGVVGMNLHYRDIRISGDQILAPNVQEFNVAAFVFEEMQLSDLFSLQGGARLELQDLQVLENPQFTAADLSGVDGRQEATFSGSLGLNFRPSPEWESGIQLARAFRTPSLEELYSDAPHSHVGAYEIGDPNLSNEVSLGADLFVLYRQERFRAELSGYLNSLHDFIMYTPAGETHLPSGLPIFRYTATDALLAGVEFNVEGRLTDRVIAGFGIDYVHGSQREEDRLEPLPFMPPLRTTFSIGYETGSWWAKSRVRLAGSQNRVADLEEPTDGYTLVGAEMGYEFGGGIFLSLRLDNLFDVTYRDHLTRVEDRNFPMPGRNIHSLIRWEF